MSHCVTAKSCRERNKQSHDHTGAPSALARSTCSCWSSQHPLVTFPESQGKGQTSCAPLRVAQTQCGTHTAALMAPHDHAGGCSAGRINQRVAHGSHSLCLPRHCTGQRSQPARIHQVMILPSAGIQTHKQKRPHEPLAAGQHPKAKLFPSSLRRLLCRGGAREPRSARCSRAEH